jgi:hypothetical protein
LPAQKRDAAWEFYLDKFAGSNAGDTLSGLILLLEANGAFLLTLPETFHAELTQPITEQLSAIRDELHTHVETQRATLRVLDAANESMERANQQLANTTAEFANKVHAAARQIDTDTLAADVSIELESSIVSPLRLALRDVPEQTKRIKAATDAAESSIKVWHALHVDGIVFNACLATLLVAGLLFCLVWFWLR